MPIKDDWPRKDWNLIHYRFLEIIKWWTYIFYWFIWKVFRFYNNKTKDKGYSSILDQSQG